MSIAGVSHIVLDKAGVAWIDRTNVKVVEVVLDRLAYGWSPEEIHFQQPHLSLAQIYAALSYYYDHQAAIDEEIREREVLVEQLRPTGPSPVREKLKRKLS